jgi:hypothetical protein
LVDNKLCIFALGTSRACTFLPMSAPAREII